MVIAWLTVFIRLGISPKLFIIFLLDENPLLKTKAFMGFMHGLGDLIGKLTVSMN